VQAQATAGIETVTITTEAKNAHFFKCTQSGFVYQELRDFVEMSLTRVSSHWLWFESSLLNVTRFVSESPKIVTGVELLTWVTLPLQY